MFDFGPAENMKKYNQVKIKIINFLFGRSCYALKHHPSLKLQNSFTAKLTVLDLITALCVEVFQNYWEKKRIK